MGTPWGLMGGDGGHWRPMGTAWGPREDPVGTHGDPMWTHGDPMGTHGGGHGDPWGPTEGSPHSFPLWNGCQCLGVRNS